MTTQLDRIENMLIMLCQHTAGLNLDQDSQDKATIYNTIRTYTGDLVEDGVKV